MSWFSAERNWKMMRASENTISSEKCMHFLCFPRLSNWRGAWLFFCCKNWTRELMRTKTFFYGLSSLRQSTINNIRHIYIVITQQVRDMVLDMHNLARKAILSFWELIDLYKSVVNLYFKGLHERPHDTIHPPFWGSRGITGANGSSWN